MKQLTYTTLTLAALILTLFIASCDGSGSGEPTPDTKALMTSGTWKTHSVTVDGIDQTLLYSNFTLTFTASGYTSANGEPVWPKSGMWTFASTDQKTFTRSDGITVTVNDVSKTELSLELAWNKTTLGSGRAESTEGSHTFVLSK